MDTKKKEIITIFEKMADILEFKGENPFKINAYRKAARVLEDLAEDIESVCQAGKLMDIPGIGSGIAKKIEEYLTTGQISKYQEISQQVPDSLIELLQIQGLGPKTLALANKELGVINLLCLERVILNGSLQKLPGMGEKKVENIKRGIKFFQANRDRILLGIAYPLVAQLKEDLGKVPGMISLCEAGSLRRMKESLGDIDLLAAGKDSQEIINRLVKLPQVKDILAAGQTKGSIITYDGIQVDLRVVDEECYGSALQYFTGSKAHNIKLREMAKKQGLKINEYGVFKGEERIGGKTEQELYSALGLIWIPPEIREDWGEIEAARDGKLPELVRQKDIRGDLHAHTTCSDGSSTIEEIALEAKRLGLEYVTICDHSQSVRYAGGLEPERLYRQIEEIALINKKLTGIRVLAGSEVDIRRDGSMDYPDELLAKLDVVVAAIHSGFQHNVTERICQAMENPQVDIIAHPTGRLISSREGYVIDVNKILEKASQTGTALEINAYYDRLDLADRYCKQAKGLGCKFTIGTDSHTKEHLWMISLGVGVARRGWLEKKDLLNTLSIDELLAYLTKK